MAELKKEHHLAGLDRERFIDRLTHHTSELNFLHPFREGNGRTTREFVRQLAQHAGYQVDYQRIEPAEWNRAAAQSNDSTRAWRDLYDRATTSLRALSFERDPRHEALQWHPELKGAYAALDRANAAAERIADKQVRESFMAERRTEIAAILHTGRVIAEPQRQAEKTLDKPPAPRGFER